MINFLRKFRKNFADNNQFLKYSRYALGEIILVVIGILIALQINNSNQERIQKNELEDLMLSISNGIRSDIRSLNLIYTARKNMGISTDSIFNSIINNDSVKMDRYARYFVSRTGWNLFNTIYFKPNLSAFESLKNSTYFGKLQGTDIELLLSTYYADCLYIQKYEEEHNEAVKKTGLEWRRKFQYDIDLIFSPWVYTNEEHLKKEKYYREVLTDNLTIEYFGHGFSESSHLESYDNLLRLGNKFIEMVESKQMNFDKQTKLDFSGILYSYEDSELINVFINGKTTNGFELHHASNTNQGVDNPFDFQDDYTIFNYPQNQLKWTVFYIQVAALQGRVEEINLSEFSKVIVEMKGAQGDEQFQMTMKDILDPPDGSESRVTMNLTDEWATYEIELDQFQTADMKTISMALGFIFIGDKGQSIHVRSIKFK